MPQVLQPPANANGAGSEGSAGSNLLDAPEAQKALQILAEDFSMAEDIGPARVGAFIGDEDPGLREEVVAFVQELIAEFA